MKVCRLFLVILLANVFLQTDIAYADDVVSVKPTVAAKAIGSDVPELKILTQKTAYGFTLCLLFLSIGLLVYKKTVLRNDSSQHNLINIISRKNLSPKTALVLVEIEGNKYLLSQNTEKIELLSEISTSVVIKENEIDNIERKFLEKKCA